MSEVEIKKIKVYSPACEKLLIEASQMPSFEYEKKEDGSWGLKDEYYVDEVPGLDLEEMKFRKMSLGLFELAKIHERQRLCAKREKKDFYSCKFSEPDYDSCPSISDYFLVEDEELDLEDVVEDIMIEEGVDPCDEENSQTLVDVMAYFESGVYSALDSSVSSIVDKVYENYTFWNVDSSFRSSVDPADLLYDKCVEADEFCARVSGRFSLSNILPILTFCDREDEYSQAGYCRYKNRFRVSFPVIEVDGSSSVIYDYYVQKFGPGCYEFYNLIMQHLSFNDVRRISSVSKSFFSSFLAECRLRSASYQEECDSYCLVYYPDFDDGLGSINQKCCVHSFESCAVFRARYNFDSFVYRDCKHDGVRCAFEMFINLFVIPPSSLFKKNLLARSFADVDSSMVANLMVLEFDRLACKYDLESHYNTTFTRIRGVVQAVSSILSYENFLLVVEFLRKVSEKCWYFSINSISAEEEYRFGHFPFISSYELLCNSNRPKRSFNRRVIVPRRKREVRPHIYNRARDLDMVTLVHPSANLRGVDPVDNFSRRVKIMLTRGMRNRYDDN